eukprot:3684028-Amphidinium_carterae.1
MACFKLCQSQGQAIMFKTRLQAAQVEAHRMCAHRCKAMMLGPPGNLRLGTDSRYCSHTPSCRSVWFRPQAIRSLCTRTHHKSNNGMSCATSTEL